MGFLSISGWDGGADSQLIGCGAEVRDADSQTTLGRVRGTAG